MAAGSVLLTGATGFIGGRLLPRLLDTPGVNAVTAVGYRTPPHGLPDRVKAVGLDLEDAPAVHALLAAEQPDLVIHLAAQSSVQSSLRSPWPAWRTNLFGTINLAEALMRVRPDAGLLFASTAEVYGRAFASGQALNETSPLAPANPYARSKAACEMALQDLMGTDSRLAVLRIFNHIGPGQDERFVASAFAAQIARIEQGLAAPVIRTGDLSVERDFGDVDDLIDALIAVVDAFDALPARSVFNVCSGTPRPVQALLDGLIAHAAVTPEVERDPDRVRPGELRRVLGSNAALRAATGWAPTRELNRTLGGLLDHWRQVVAAER